LVEWHQQNELKYYLAIDFSDNRIDLDWMMKVMEMIDWSDMNSRVGLINIAIDIDNIELDNKNRVN